MPKGQTHEKALIDAPSDIESIHPGGFEHLGNTCGVTNRQSAFHQVVCIHAHNDGEIGPDKLPRTGDDLQEKRHSAVQITAVLV